MATAVITGASSGIGREFALHLADMGYSLVLVARREDKLLELSEHLPVQAECIRADLSRQEDCYALYEACRGKDVSILINNAGFGNFGFFCDSDPERETEMIDVNVRAVHILTKLFLKDFTAKNEGKILNVASSAGFMPAGPLMASYYASKAYVLSLSQSIAKELKKSGSAVTVSTLCPGPVKTEFDEVAGVRFAADGITAAKAASSGIRGMLKGKRVIVPGAAMKTGRIFTKILPDSVLTSFAYRFQKAKGE